MCIEHIGTNSIIADMLTKGLLPKVFHEHTNISGLAKVVKGDNCAESLEFS